MATIRRVSRTRVSYIITDDYTDFSHRAGINALAIDTDTHVAWGGDTTKADRGGILYSGGRDAVVNSWDLHLALGRRSHPPQKPDEAERMDFFGSTEPSPSSAPVSSTLSEPDLVNGRTPHAKKLSQSQSSFVASGLSSTTGVASSPAAARAPLEISLDSHRRVYSPPATTHRSTFRHHSDWINDIVLVNGNKHFVSASNDRTLNLWTAHPSNEFDSAYLVGPPANPPYLPQPHRLGAHTDYVKSLAGAPLANWVASAGTDRRICLWSLQECRPAPVRSLWGVNLYNEGATVVMGEPQASVYAVGTNKVGSVLVSGSTEGYVRCWDPRVPRRTVKMVGHTDNIRAVVVSEDGRWVLSASSDATIKLWHLASPHRCVATWSHSASSVWSLFSTHPTLDVWWAGGKDGWIWKGGRGAHEAQGEGKRVKSYEEEPGDVVAVGRESNGVVKLVAVDDLFVWTATSSSSIHRWPDVPFGVTKPVYYTLPTPSVDKEPSTASFLYPAFIPSANEPTNPYTIPASSIIRAASGSPLSASKTSVLPTAERAEESEELEVEPANHNPDAMGTIKGMAGIVSWQVLNNRREVVAVDSEGGVALWDIIRCVKTRTLPAHTPLASVLADPAINPLDWSATWCTLDARTGNLTVHLEESRAFDAEAYWEDAAKGVVGVEVEDQRVNVGKWILTHLFHNFREACKNPGFKGSQSITTMNTLAVTDSPVREPNGEVPGGGGARDTANTAAQSSTLPSRSSYDGAHASSVDEITGPKVSLPTSLDPAAPVPSNAPSTTVLVTGNSTSASAPPTPVPSGPPTPDRQMSFGTEKPAAGTPPASSSGFMDMFKWRKKGGDGGTSNDRTRSGTNDEDSVGGMGAIKPDHPPLVLPPQVPIIVSVEESSEASNFLDLYRGTAATIGNPADVERLRQVIPTWVYEFVVEKKSNTKEPVKMSFVMSPALGSDLPELPNGNNRLSANRMLRIKKLLSYIAEKLSLEESTKGTGQLKPEQFLELCCHGQSLDSKLTLAAVRYNLWKGGGDMVLTYRYIPPTRAASVVHPSPLSNTRESRKSQRGSAGGSSGSIPDPYSVPTDPPYVETPRSRRSEDTRRRVTQEEEKKRESGWGVLGPEGENVDIHHAVLMFYGLEREELGLETEVWPEDSTASSAPPTTDGRMPDLLGGGQSRQAPAFLDYTENLALTVDQDPLGVKESIFPARSKKKMKASSSQEAMEKKGDQISPKRLGNVEHDQELIFYFRRTASDPRLNINSKSFQPTLFLREVHRNTGFDDLDRGADHLRHSVAQWNDTLKVVVKENFDRFVTAKSTIDGKIHFPTSHNQRVILLARVSDLYKEFRSRDMNSSVEFGLENFGVALEAATTRAKEVWLPLLERREQAERIRIALGMLERWKVFFNLPSSLQDSMRRGKVDVAVRDYKRGKLLMQTVQRPQKIFDRVWGEVEKIVSSLCTQLLKQLDDPWAPLDSQEKVIGYLLDLDSEADPVWFYLGSQFRFIVGLMQDAYQEYVSRLELIRRGGQSTMHNLPRVNVSGPPALGRRGMSTKVAPPTRKATAEPDSTTQARSPAADSDDDAIDGKDAGGGPAKVAGMSASQFTKAIVLAGKGGKEYQKAFARDIDVQLWKATAKLIKRLSHVLLNSLPDFWRLVTHFAEGKFSKGTQSSQLPDAQRRKRQATDSRKLDQVNFMMKQIVTFYSSVLSEVFFLSTPLTTLRTGLSDSETGPPTEGRSLSPVPPTSVVLGASAKNDIEGDGDLSERKLAAITPPPPPPAELSTYLFCHPLTASHFFARVLEDLVRACEELRTVKVIWEDESMTYLIEIVEKIKWRATEVVCNGIVRESRNFYQYEDWTFDIEGPQMRRYDGRTDSDGPTNWSETTTFLRLYNHFIKSSLRAVWLIVNSNASIYSDDSVGTRKASSSNLALGGSSNDIRLRENLDKIRTTFFDSFYAIIDGLQWLAVEWRPSRGGTSKRGALMAIDGDESGIAADSILDLESAARRKSDMAWADEVAFKDGSVTPTTAPATKKKTKAVDVSRQDVRSLVVLSNLTHFRNSMVPKLLSSFQEIFAISVNKDAQTFREIADHLDAIIFEAFIRRKTVRLDEVVRTGILYSGIDWFLISRPQEVSPYVYDLLVSLVMIHSEVSDVSKSLVRRALSELFVEVAQCVLSCFRKVDKFSVAGMLQATLETEFLHQSLTNFETPLSSLILKLVYESVERGTVYEDELSAGGVSGLGQLRGGGNNAGMTDMLRNPFIHKKLLAKHAPAPVINGLTAKFHPLQILADIMTLYETYAPGAATAAAPLPHLSNLKVAWVGDGNNILNDLLVSLPRIGVSLAAATPKGYESPEDVVDFAKKHSRGGANGSNEMGALTLTSDPFEAVHNADVLVTDTWISMGQEAEKAKRLQAFANYQITESMARKGGAKPDWKFMHCLPRKSEEVDEEVFYGPRSIVWQEGENRKYTVMAVYEMLMLQANKSSN
ncbi:hypothetical protein HDU93_009969 [Gonapodya sp. JEL0774]|nr:hypothetical protein HDU93_009969 [Gonapodya sp. JEL0774]